MNYPEGPPAPSQLPLRPVIDLARTRPFMDGVVAADAAIRLLKANKPELLAIITDCTRSPGLDGARRVVEFSNGLSGSPLESCARVVFDAYGLPPPELQATIHAGYKVGDDGKLLYLAEYHDYVVDFRWQDRMTIAETDGKLKYKSGQDAIRQAKRDTLLQDQGYRVVHITWDDLFRHPQLVVKRILDAFAATSTHLAYLFDHPNGLYPRNASKRGLKRPPGRQDCG